jgi:hypothetical protein
MQGTPTNHPAKQQRISGCKDNQAALQEAATLHANPTQQEARMHFHLAQ